MGTLGTVVLVTAAAGVGGTGLGGGAAEDQQQLDLALQPFEKLFLRRGSLKIGDLGKKPSCEKVAETVKEIKTNINSKR